MTYDGHICSLPKGRRPRTGHWHCEECGQNWRYDRNRDVWRMVPPER